MCDELVKKIRHCATDPMHCLSCGEDKDGRCFKRLMTQAADAIEELSKPRWIPVTERLPEEPGEYIVFIRDPFCGKDEPQDEFNVDASYVTSCFYDKDAGLWREWDNSYYCANLQCVNTNKTYYISHWQPLPEPPKEE